MNSEDCPEDEVLLDLEKDGYTEDNVMIKLQTQKYCEKPHEGDGTGYIFRISTNKCESLIDPKCKRHTDVDIVNLGNTINERSYDEQLMEDVEDSYHSISGDVSSVGLNSVHLISPTDIDSGFKYEEEHKSFGSEISVTESNDINIEESENEQSRVSFSDQVASSYPLVTIVENNERKTEGILKTSGQQRYPQFCPENAPKLDSFEVKERLSVVTSQSVPHTPAKCRVHTDVDVVDWDSNSNDSSCDEQSMEDVEDTHHPLSGDIRSVGLNSIHLISPTDTDSRFTYEEVYESFGGEVSVTESNDINIEEESEKEYSRVSFSDQVASSYPLVAIVEDKYRKTEGILKTSGQQRYHQFCPENAPKLDSFEVQGRLSMVTSQSQPPPPPPPPPMHLLPERLLREHNTNDNECDEKEQEYDDELYDFALGEESTVGLNSIHSTDRDHIDSMLNRKEFVSTWLGCANKSSSTIHEEIPSRLKESTRVQSSSNLIVDLVSNSDNFLKKDLLQVSAQHGGHHSQTRSALVVENSAAKGRGVIGAVEMIPPSPQVIKENIYKKKYSGSQLQISPEIVGSKSLIRKKQRLLQLKKQDLKVQEDFTYAPTGTEDFSYAPTGIEDSSFSSAKIEIEGSQTGSRACHERSMCKLTLPEVKNCYPMKPSDFRKKLSKLKNRSSTHRSKHIARTESISIITPSTLTSSTNEHRLTSVESLDHEPVHSHNHWKWMDYFWSPGDNDLCPTRDLLDDTDSDEETSIDNTFYSNKHLKKNCVEIKSFTNNSNLIRHRTPDVLLGLEIGTDDSDLEISSGSDTDSDSGSDTKNDSGSSSNICLMRREKKESVHSTSHNSAIILQRWWRLIFWKQHFRFRCKFRQKRYDNFKKNPNPMYNSKSEQESVDESTLPGRSKERHQMANTKSRSNMKLQRNVKEIILLQSFFRCSNTRFNFNHRVKPAIILIQSFFRSIIYSKIYRREQSLRLFYSSEKWDKRQNIVRVKKKILKLSGESLSHSAAQEKVESKGDEREEKFVKKVKYEYQVENNLQTEQDNINISIFDNHSDDRSSEDDDEAISTSLVSKKSGVLKRLVKRFSRDNTLNKSTKCKKKKKRIPFKQKKMAITRVEPLLGDPDTMTHLPDPLSLYRPPSSDEGEKNDQSMYCSEEPQTKPAIVESYCKDDLPSECSTFSSRNRVNSDISAKKKRTPFKQKKIAVPNVQPLIGDPETMTHLPDPLSLYRPPSFDEEEENSQPANSFDDQRKISVTVESYCEDDLSSEYSSFSGYDLSKCKRLAHTRRGNPRIKYNGIGSVLSDEI